MDIDKSVNLALAILISNNYKLDYNYYLSTTLQKLEKHIRTWMVLIRWLANTEMIAIFNSVRSMSWNLS
jgi:hypothetical protein